MSDRLEQGLGTYIPSATLEVKDAIIEETKFLLLMANRAICGGHCSSSTVIINQFRIVLLKVTKNTFEVVLHC